MRAPNVLTISPALPFLETFVTALRAGEVVPGLSSDPMALVDATIYLPTRRSAVALCETIFRHAGSPSLLLPRILPLGALEATETELFLAEPDPVVVGLPLPPAATPIWRRLRLAHLIQAWAQAVGGALCAVDATGARVVDASETFNVATSTVDAFALAGDLASLIDEMQIEGVAWREIDALKMAGFDDYWRITTTFLSIAIERWPAVLAEAGLVDPAARQIALVDAQAAALAAGRAAGPVIAIGSTGTNKATARLLAAIARAPKGAVVLPGLDLDLDDAAWSLVGGREGPGQETSHGHPQAAMARLLPALGLARADVRPLGTPEPTRAARARLVAEALRPADTTDQWRAYRRKVSQKAMASALENVALIEAADEREEALCLAIALREVLETPGRTAALVTPDRELARRVRGELLRWTIEVTDTGGEPLSSRPLGVLARLVAAAARHGGAREMTALLGHPLATFGRPSGEVARLAQLLEVGVLRVVDVDGRDADDIFATARRAAGDRHAHRALKAITEADWTAMAALWRDVGASLAPLRSLDDSYDLKRWTATHRVALAAVAGPADPEEAGLLDGLFDELEASGSTLRLDALAYGTLFGRLISEATLRTSATPHPRIAIYGLLEARLMPVDVVLLGGLDETIWPPQAKLDPFLNRPMRAELGLSPPERRIGQTAHDFAQAMSAPIVVLSRARKRGGAPTVASRMLLRLEALAAGAWTPVRVRGKRYVELAHALDRPLLQPVPVARPRPTPPVDLRPRKLSVTQVETLRRDPYAVFAAQILKLSPLPQLGQEIDPSQFGSIMHAALHEFVRAPEASGEPDTRHAKLEALLREGFATALLDSTFCTFRWPLIRRAMQVFLTFDTKQRETMREVLVEETGTLDLVLADGSSFILSARADRIDLHRDGRATLIDYKTGQPPGLDEVRVGFAPQLTLEAAILRGGGFGVPPKGEIAATYLKLGGKDGGKIQPLDFGDDAFAAVVDRHMQGLVRLLSSFCEHKTGYPSRPFPKFAKAFGDYDHLARVREWSLVGDEDVA